MTECIHSFQHVIGKGVQYCLDCKEVLYGTGKFGQVTEKDQKLANQHKCSSKKRKSNKTKLVENQEV